MEKKNYELTNGECLEEMKKIKDKSVNLILCDLPYSITGCSWDKKIDIDKLWNEYKRIIKCNGTIVLFGQEPFSSELRMVNKEWYKYDIIWDKVTTGNATLCKVQPIRIHENIMVFYDTSRYYTEKDNEVYKIMKYLRDERDKSKLKNSEVDEIVGGKGMNWHYFGLKQFQIPTREKYKLLQMKTGNFDKPYDELLNEYNSSIKNIYNPQGLTEYNKKIKLRPNPILDKGKNKEKNQKEYIRKYTNYPKSIITFQRDNDGFHPTQKPVTLLEYLIKTYSNEGDIVLDNTMGSGSTGVACMNTGRKFIGIELDRKYFEIAAKRIKEAEENLEKK